MRRSRPRSRRPCRPRPAGAGAGPEPRLPGPRGARPVRQPGAKELGLALGREATAASLAEVGLPELIRAQTAVRDALAAQPDPLRFGATIVASSMAFIPVVDGDLIPVHPLAAVAAGAGSTPTP